MKIIRIDAQVRRELDAKRRDGESYAALLRRLLGLPPLRHQRNGTTPTEED